MMFSSFGLIRIYVLGDTAFGTINLINQIRGDSFNHHGILGIAKTRTLKDGRKVSEIKTRGQQVYLNGLDLPVFLSWVWLKRDGIHSSTVCDFYQANER